MSQHGITIETADYRGRAGHCFRIERDRQRAPVRIVEEWLPPADLTREHHATLPDALRSALEQLRAPLRQKEAEARRAARPEQMALGAAMGRPMDWNRSRQAVTKAVQDLGGIESALRLLPSFRTGMSLERIQREVSRCRAPIALDLAPPRLSVPGAMLEAGTQLYLLEDAIEGGEVISLTVSEVHLHRQSGACRLIHECREADTGRTFNLASGAVGLAVNDESETLFADRISAERALVDRSSSAPRLG